MINTWGVTGSPGTLGLRRAAARRSFGGGPSSGRAPMAAARLGFCAGEKGGGLGVQIKGCGGDAIYRGCRAALVCGPSRGAAARVRAGLLELESRSDGRKEKPPMGGPGAAERGEGEGVAPIWAVERENGPAVGLLGRGERRKREREKGEMGWVETRERGRKKGFSIFENDSNTFI